MNHPPLPHLADHARTVAKLLDQSAGHDPSGARNGTCRCLTCRARLLAANGYPTSTMGDGTGTRTSDPTSSTERAALKGAPNDPHAPWHAGPWATIDTDLAAALRAWWHAGLTVLTLADRINAHAPDDDPTPAGTGPCSIRTCDTTCRPDHRRPDNRLRSGLCPACWVSWRKHLTRNPQASLTDWKPVRTAALRPKPVAM